MIVDRFASRFRHAVRRVYETYWGVSPKFDMTIAKARNQFMGESPVEVQIKIGFDRKGEVAKKTIHVRPFETETVGTTGVWWPAREDSTIEEKVREMIEAEAVVSEAMVEWRVRDRSDLRILLECVEDEFVKSKPSGA